MGVYVFSNAFAEVLSKGAKTRANKNGIWPVQLTACANTIQVPKQECNLISPL